MTKPNNETASAAQAQAEEAKNNGSNMKRSTISDYLPNIFGRNKPQQSEQIVEEPSPAAASSKTLEERKQN